MIRAFENFSKFLGIATGAVVVCMISAAMVSLNIQVFTRYVLGQSASWSEELAIFLFTWSILLVGSLGVREKFHVSLTFIIDFSPRKIRIIFEKLLHILTLAFGVFFAFSGYHYVERTLGQISAAVQYPIEWLHLAAPVSGILICIHACAHLISNPNEEQSTSESTEGSGSKI